MVIRERNTITYSTRNRTLPVLLPEEFILILDKLFGAVKLLLTCLDLLLELNILLVKS